MYLYIPNWYSSIYYTQFYMKCSELLCFSLVHHSALPLSYPVTAMDSFISHSVIICIYMYMVNLYQPSKISQFWNVGSLYKRCPLFNKDPSTLTFIKKSGGGRETVQILSDIHHISEVDIRNALHSPIGPLVGVKTYWDYRQLMGLKGPAFVNVFAWPEIHWP